MLRAGAGSGGPPEQASPALRGWANHFGLIDDAATFGGDRARCRVAYRVRT